MSGQHVMKKGTMQRPLAFRLLLLLLLSAAVESAAVWLHSRNRKGLSVHDSSNGTACSRKPAAVLLPELPRGTVSALPYADTLGQGVAAAAAATAPVRRTAQRPLKQRPAVIPQSGSPLFPSGAVGSEVAVPPCSSSGIQAQKETSVALDSVVAAGDDLSLRRLLSRQLLVWGPEQQKVLPGSRVLLIGAGGAAVEAAKCLLQSGVGCVLLADPEEPAPQERAANFALAEHAEQQEAAASEAADASAVPKAAGAARDSCDPTGRRVCLPAQVVENHEQQQQPVSLMTRAGIACAALRRVGAPYARVSEVSLHIQQGETAAAWRARVETVLKQVDVILLCDRPLQQKLFYSAMARELWSKGKEQQLRNEKQEGQRQQQHQQQPRRHRRMGGPLVVAVCTAGLTGRVAVDFGDFIFSRVSEESALTALLQKHAQPQMQQQQPHPQQHQEQQIERLHFAPLSAVLALPEPKQAIERHKLLGLHELLGPQQQYLNAAFEALDAAEADGRGANAEHQQATIAQEDGARAAGASGFTTEDSADAEACADAGSLRSWNANRLPAASLVATRAAAIWKRRYGPVAAREAAAAATAAARASHQSAAAVTAAAEAAAAAALTTGEVEAGRGPFVLHALELLELTAQHQNEDDAKRGASGDKGGSNNDARTCRRYVTAVSSGSPAQGTVSPPTPAEPRAKIAGAAAGETASLRAARAMGVPPREAAARRVPWEGQQQLLGWELQRRLNHLRVLLVGAGAIGCEVLKNFALMGVSANCSNSSSTNGSSKRELCCNNSNTSRGSPSRSNKGRDSRLVRLLATCFRGIRCSMLRRASAGAAGATVSAAAAAQEACTESCGRGLLSLIDGDTVETSNLSRQVLFTAASLQQPKATAAAAATQRLCSRTRLRPFPFMLSPENFGRLPSMYIQGQDLVVAALDSVEARLYVDGLCLLHAKPWVEAGTLGLRGHAQSLVPYLTEHYAAAVRGAGASASQTAQSLKAVPVCSVRGAPTAPIHAVHWASAQLQQTFKMDIAAAYMLLQQLLEQQMQLQQRTPAEEQVHGGGEEAAAPAHAAVLGASDDTKAALSMLGMAPVAVAAAAAGSMRLRLLLRLAVEILRAHRSTMELSEEGGQEALHQLHRKRELWQMHYKKHVDNEGGVCPLSAAHLKLLSFAVFFFRALYQRAAVEKSTGGNAVASDDSTSKEKDAKGHRRQTPLLLDPADADVLDFVASTAQLLAASLGIESHAKATRTLDNGAPQSAPILQQEQAEELLLQGKGLGPWSRQCVAEALQRLLPKAGSMKAAPRGIAGADSDPMAISACTLAEELVREVAAAQAAATAGADMRPLGGPAALSLSADDAVPLRFITSAARLRCRAFGLEPLPGPEETQQLIGSIVPATATATTLAAALACLEVYRLVALGLAGAFSSQLVPHREQRQQQKQQRQITQHAGRGSAVLWLDRGERRNRQLSAKQQQDVLRSSFFSLSVPFLAEAPPLPPPTHHFRLGRWRGQPFSPWHFFRLRLRGGSFNSSSKRRVGGVAPGEAEAAEAITISELVELIERETQVRVLSLTCEGTLLYAAPKESGTLQQQMPAVLPHDIAALFSERPRQILPDPGTKLTEALRNALLVSSHSETRQRCQQQQQQSAKRLQQQDKGTAWAVVLIAASDLWGDSVPLPAVKVLIRPTA
ncbi:ubiquitin-activating enzyme e1, putative [Eimeria praecox]|uniref:Ubiquitin-activating enzyme e1, putative n=1 Tax=Eimeria praecox TaxID=51316 RepID=U6H1M0_9EIME|nr:ubiquitin-activating enzyme e1, putative [Eimeria praecox]